MKKYLLFIWLTSSVFFLCLFSTTHAQVAIDETHFPDSVFRAYVKTNLDTDGDGELSQAECEAVREIDVSGEIEADDSGIHVLRSPLADLTGIEYFPALEELYCSETDITSLDVSGNPALKVLSFDNTGITILDVSGNPALEELYCSETGITGLDVNRNPALKMLSCDNTRLTSLDVSGNPALEILSCTNTRLTSLDMSGCPALEGLFCFDNTGLTSLDVSQNPALRELNCNHTELMSLDVSRNPALEELYCSNTGLTSLDVSQNPELIVLECYDTRREVKAEVGGICDLSRLPGFDVSRAFNWKGGSIQGSILTFNDTAVTYQYATLYAGESEEVPATLEFKLVANPDAEDDAGLPPHPSAVPFAAYAREGNLYLQGIRGMVEVFDLQGRRIYRGTSNPVELPSQGVYIVRNQGYGLKVPNL